MVLYFPWLEGGNVLVDWGNRNSKKPCGLPKKIFGFFIFKFNLFLKYNFILIDFSFPLYIKMNQNKIKFIFQIYWQTKQNMIKLINKLKQNKTKHI